MDTVLFLDPSIGTDNLGDEIIMGAIEKELQYITDGKFVRSLPTQVSSFHCYQIWRNSFSYQIYKNSILKFVCGSNLLVPNMLTHFPQWNLNIFNYQAFKGCILVGIGKGAGDKTNYYTSYLYRHLLNKEYYHSVRDERTKIYLESLGLKAICTGCPTMWMLTPEFCEEIPQKKSKNVVFTLTSCRENPQDKQLISILRQNYENVYYWPQGIEDYDYLHFYDNIDGINIINPSLEDYNKLLEQPDIEYVGTRLHGGINAMRHKKRSIIIAIDERAREINKKNNLNCIEKANIGELESLIQSEFATKVTMPLDEINLWKSQFNDYVSK